MPFTRVRIGHYAGDPSACDAFHAFDPESYVVVSAIADSLIYIDHDGMIRPGLATSWKRIDPLTMEFELRRGVHFHNGEPFDADSVVATLRAQRNPDNDSPTGQGILGSIASCRKLDQYRVSITSYFPDAMFLPRLHLFSAIYPRSVLDRDGPHALRDHPIGTGAYQFHEWRRGEAIVLRRNPDHWAQAAVVDELVFPIAKQKDWLDLLSDGMLDIALNVGTHDAHAAANLSGVDVSWRDGLLVHWFIWRNRGHLADRRVRRALNHAVHKKLLIDIAGNAHARVQIGNAWHDQVGHDHNLKPYAYDPDLARRLLAEAGCGQGFALDGLVADVNNSSFQLLRGFFASVDIQLEGEIVPRGEFMRIVTENKMDQAAGKYSGRERDFTYSMYDNTLGHPLLHHFMALFSESPLSLWSSEEYDRHFVDALTAEPADLDRRIRTLDRYMVEQALALFTIREPVYVVTRHGFEIPIQATGHFDYDSLWQIKAPSRWRAATPTPTRSGTGGRDIERLLEATSYPGTLFLPEHENLEDPSLAQLWRNIELGDARWKQLSERMTRSLVDQVAAQNRLDNISRSTESVGILVLTDDDRVVFENYGYAPVTGCASSEPLEQILRDDEGNTCWPRIKATTARTGSWAGVLDMKDRRIHLTVTPALNELDDRTGFVCVFFDYAREEERLRIKAQTATAGLVQKALIPAPDDDDDRAAYYAPAEECGGDWYHIEDTDRYLTLMIGDVTGHGTPAALVTASVAGATSVLDLDARSPGQILGHFNTVIRNTGFGQYYMSFFHIKIDKHTREYEFSSAAHHSPILVGSSGVGTIPTRRALGHLLGDCPAGTEWPQASGVLEPGSLIFLYTDGISEGRNARDVEYGFSRLRRFFRKTARDRPCHQVLDALLADARAYYGDVPLMDDLTLVLARVR